jgi:hypothetical protein
MGNIKLRRVSLLKELFRLGSALEALYAFLNFLCDSLVELSENIAIGVQDQSQSVRIPIAAAVKITRSEPIVAASRQQSAHQ